MTVRDAATGDFVPKVQVKVIGSGNADFVSGETDLRGVFVAEGVSGEAAAVARKGAAQYAFYRGTTPLGDPRRHGRRAPAADEPAAAARSPRPSAAPAVAGGQPQVLNYVEPDAAASTGSRSVTRPPPRRRRARGARRPAGSADAK